MNITFVEFFLLHTLQIRCAFNSQTDMRKLSIQVLFCWNNLAFDKTILKNIGSIWHCNEMTWLNYFLDLKCRSVASCRIKALKA